MHQKTFAIARQVSATTYEYETQRVYLADFDVSLQNTERIQKTVRIKLADNTITNAVVSNHPQDDCKSILTITSNSPPAALTTIYGPQIAVGRFEDFLHTYSSSTTTFPFLFLNDALNIKNADNILHIVSFELYLVGFINSSLDSVSLSVLNNYRSYITNMLRNVDVVVNSTREFSRLQINDKTSEKYVILFNCETSILQKYV